MMAAEFLEVQIISIKYPAQRVLVQFRKMVGFKNPPKPSEKLGRIELKAELEDD